MNPRIAEATPLDNYKILLCFTNGEKGIYDCTPLLNFGVFKELREPDYFQRVSVMNGTVAWPNEQDICPDTLYIDAVKIVRAT
jgi:hypothetical protein